MSIVDVTGKSLTLKIVYFGCAMGGKTTNLVTLHRLTDPDGAQGMVSIATQDDRTLFFDLLPLDLGRIGGLNVRVKVYTVPGQVHYELTRRQVLAGADGVVMVIDSAPDVAQSNAWAVENLKFNLKQNKIDPETIPTVFQWNKRDLRNARPVTDLDGELNSKGHEAFEAVATEGAGVADTFAEVVKRAILQAYEKAGRTITDAAVTIDEKVDQALAVAIANQPPLPGQGGENEEEGRPAAPAAGDGDEEAGTPQPDFAFEHRVDMDEYRDKWAEQGRDRRIMDQETLLSEAVQTGMELAERLEGMRKVEELSKRRAVMMGVLGKMAPVLADSSRPALPEDMLHMLMEACNRARGSMLLYKPGERIMEEREVVGAEGDLLNTMLAKGVDPPAYTLCRTNRPRLVEDLRTEVFFDAVPEGMQNEESALVLPLVCDGLALGGLVIYGTVTEPPFDMAEREFWNTASILISLSLHWRALRRKVVASKAAS